MPGIDFDAVRRAITIEQVLEQIGFEPSSRSGDQWRGPCPVHRSSSPHSRSFSVNVKSGRYYCHKCHSQGNQLELWAAIRQLPIYEAALDLCQSLGQEIPFIQRGPAERTRSRTEREQKRRGTGN